MKIDWKVWIPVIGIYFAFQEGWILLLSEWNNYQLFCCIVTALALMSL